MKRPPAAAALLLAAVAPHARAQSAPADSLPVHAGTWALEGGVGFAPFLPGGGSVGALRFLGARSALTLNLTGGYESETRDQPSSFGESTQRSVYVGANAGARWYTPVRGGIAGFGGTGVTGSYQRVTSGPSATRTNVGGYGELGAAYLVARRLTVNASTALSVVRTGGRSESVAYFGPDQPPTRTTSRARGWDVGAGGVRLSATLYF